jgi:hypothetical protein
MVLPQPVADIVIPLNIIPTAEQQHGSQRDQDSDEACETERPGHKQGLRG